MLGNNTSMPQYKKNRAAEVIARCRQIAACTEIAGETTRTFLAPSMHDAHTLLRQWMEAAGMAVEVDAIGNLRGLYPASAPGAPSLIIGSHLDTVPDSGAFDGVLGVVLGVALVEELDGERLPFAIEIVGFSEEEGVRFGRPYLGSLAFVGDLDSDTLRRTDAANISVSAAIREFGLDPAKLGEAVVSDDAFAYLEVHIEQGPVLESEGTKLGIVSAIAGQTRMQLRFGGQANHAGTTPMHLRHDAMAAAAQWICEVERYAAGVNGLTATVGRVRTRPGAGNVIAGEVIASLDVRHSEDGIRRAAARALLAAAADAGATRGVSVETLSAAEEDAVPTDIALAALLRNAALSAGYATRTMVSGAGHDARIVASRLPIAMLFLRSPGGLSHHPDESVHEEDVEAALATALAFVDRLRDAANRPPSKSTSISVAKKAYA
jgi:allantoate deiminase